MFRVLNALDLVHFIMGHHKLVQPKMGGAAGGGRARARGAAAPPLPPPGAAHAIPIPIPISIPEHYLDFATTDRKLYADIKSFRYLLGGTDEQTDRRQRIIKY